MGPIGPPLGPLTMTNGGGPREFFGFLSARLLNNFGILPFFGGPWPLTGRGRLPLKLRWEGGPPLVIRLISSSSRLFLLFPFPLPISVPDSEGGGGGATDLMII